MTMRLLGPCSWSCSRDDEGNREYKLMMLFETDDPKDGPKAVLDCPDAPQYGDPWKFDNDYDEWATCKQSVSVKPKLNDEPNLQWEAEYTFSTKSDDKKCKDQQIEDPLLQPPKVSGSFKKYTEEAAEDRFGNPIQTSSWEQMRGSQVEFDRNRPSVKIEQNVINLQYTLLALLCDRVNSAPLWGFPRRCVKLSDVSWEVKYYGKCYQYYTRSLEFDVQYETFDRDLLDEGSKVLHGHWETNGEGWVVDKVGGLDPPAKPTLSAVKNETGALPPGLYGYRIVANNAIGSTTPSPEATVTVVAPNNAVQLRWPALPGATGYTVYGRTAGAELAMGEARSILGTPGFVDTGLLIPAGALPVVNTAGGFDANPFDPTHFDVFKDRNGENSKVVLNGAGLPAGVVTLDHNRFLFWADGPNAGIPTSNTLFWLPIKSPTPTTWTGTNKAYAVGDLVHDDDAVHKVFSDYICIQANGGTLPARTPAVNPAFWKPLDEINNQGKYSAKVEYVTGDYVTAPYDPGRIHVEKYDEGDFLLLGIPTVI